MIRPASTQDDPSSANPEDASEQVDAHLGEYATAAFRKAWDQAVQSGVAFLFVRDDQLIRRHPGGREEIVRSLEPSVVIDHRHSLLLNPPE